MIFKTLGLRKIVMNEKGENTELPRFPAGVSKLCPREEELGNLH